MTRKIQRLKLSLSERRTFLICGDILFLFLSILLSMFFWQRYHYYKSYQAFSYHFIWQQRIVFLLIIPWIFISVISDSYKDKITTNLLSSIRQPFQTSLLVSFVYIVIYFFSPSKLLPRVVLIYFAFISSISLVLWHLLHFRIFCHTELKSQILIIGKTKAAKEIQCLINDENPYYRIIDCISTEELELKEIRYLQVDKIVYAFYQFTEENIELLIGLRELGIPLTPMPIFCERLTRRIPLDHLKGKYISFLPLEGNRSAFYPILKRAIDIFLCCLGIVFFLPLFPVIALAIKWSSRGPIFYTQMRVGKNGKHFKLWKFRSMLNESDVGDNWTDDDDVRITKVGKFIRKMHLDELPQLWNLFKGDVSVVGVRPLAVDQCEKFNREIPFHKLRHLVKPGLTSWAVVNYRYVNDINGAKRRLEYDLYYVKYHSLLLDTLIIFRTIWTMVTFNGL